MNLLRRIWRRILDPHWDIYEATYPKPSDLTYCGYDGDTAWAFRTPEELGAWAAEHPQGTIDVIARRLT